jgi:hypothetical protein
VGTRAGTAMLARAREEVEVRVDFAFVRQFLASRRALMRKHRSWDPQRRRDAGGSHAGWSTPPFGGVTQDDGWLSVLLAIVGSPAN